MRNLRDNHEAGSRQGFSLLEVLIATAVLAFGILGMAQLFLLSIQQNRRAAQNTQSSNLLAHRLEQLREMDYCWLRAVASGTWVKDVPIAGENMGQKASDPKVFAGRERKSIGNDSSSDWVIERRIVKDLGAIQQQAVGEVILIELRGYRRGVRSEGMAKPKWQHMSDYRSMRMPDSELTTLCGP